MNFHTTKNITLFPKYQMLVNPDWVNALISDRNPQTYPGKGFVILELTSNNTKDEVGLYNAGHIPGAIHLNIRSLNQDYPIEEYTLFNGKLLYGAALQAKIEALGITKDTTVVLYEYDDVVWTARMAWVLLYAGVADVRILNGAWKAWVESGYPIETAAHTGHPVNFGASVPVHPEYRCESDDLQAMLCDPTAVIGDTRSWDEHIGASNGYSSPPEFTQKGRIPGAVWVRNYDWYLHFKDLEACKKGEGIYRLRCFTDVEQMWKQAGLTPDKKIAFYCGGGYRASLPFLYAYMLGYPKVSIYDGSWYEWSFGPNGTSLNPLETGDSELSERRLLRKPAR